MKDLLNKVHCIDALALLKMLPDASVDAVITDPPYGNGLDSWDKTPAIDILLADAYRIMKTDSFFAFTISAPYDLRWRNALGEHGFDFVDQIVWVKRVPGRYGSGLVRGHETLYIYRKGKPKYYEVKGKYEDVKLPGLMFDTISIDGIERTMSHLRLAVKTGEKKKLASGTKAAVHLGAYRPGRETDSAPDFSNFTTVWSFLPARFSAHEDADFEHPSIKPILLMRRLVSLLTAPNAIVLDPFAGSGTTAVAAATLNRRFIVGDISEEYCAIARKRLETVTPNMFEVYGGFSSQNG